MSVASAGTIYLAASGMPFANRVAIVTGAGQVIGRAVAEDLAGRGAFVMALDAKKSHAEATALAIEASGGFALALECDISKRDQVNSCVQYIVERQQRLDILVNVTGLDKGSPLSELTEDLAQTQIGSTLFGHLWLSQLVAPHMEQGHWGRIVNVPCIVGTICTTDSVVQASTIGGLVGFTKGLARGLAPAGITANCVCPGRTDIGSVLEDPPVLQDLIDSAAAKNPMRRLANLKDITNAVAFFASDAASYVTGAVLSVDGAASRLP